MDEDSILYCFDSIKDFYIELDERLGVNCKSEEEVQLFIDRYFQFLLKYQNEYVSSSKQIDSVAYKLMDSNVYLEHSTFILHHILSGYALQDEVSNELTGLAYAHLYYIGREDSRWMTFIVTKVCVRQENLLFQKILKELQLFRGGYQLMSISFHLLFEMGKVAKANANDLDKISVDTFTFFFHLAENTKDDSEEEFNYQVIYFIMMLNEQYMMAHLQNRVLDAITSRLGLCDTLTQNLIFMLNRTEDARTQVLILKLIYGIFGRPETCDFFYTNDLYVLVDIILRRLGELGDDKESSKVCNSYLRVLYPLLIRTPLYDKTYKHHEVYKALCLLISPCLHRKVRPTTQKLVQKILEDWWEPIICNKSIAPVLGRDVKHVLIESLNPNTSAIAMSSTSSLGSIDSENGQQQHINNINSKTNNTNEEDIRISSTNDGICV
ncbi:hypothetical protein K501DRAFT_250390 [Backusella circina FSU 941]|nr:hypothetical protein K501DRAFT_250390 [Backusella circina FSU 941]